MGLIAHECVYCRTPRLILLVDSDASIMTSFWIPSGHVTAALFLFSDSMGLLNSLGSFLGVVVLDLVVG